MSLAIFDLDDTLLAGDSDHAWGEFLIEQGVVNGPNYRRENDRYYAQYHAGTLDIREYLAFALRPLAQIERATLYTLRARFIAQRIIPMITPKARALVERHRGRGDTLLIITSTNSFVTAPIAQAFGIEHLIATELEQRDGRYTGKISGVPCFREGKIERLDAWRGLHGADLAGSHGYSDSHNDLPLLIHVAHPFAVDPDPTLKREAEARGWPIISLR